MLEASLNECEKLYTLVTTQENESSVHISTTESLLCLSMDLDLA
jgi:hypothetical protein